MKRVSDLSHEEAFFVLVCDGNFDGREVSTRDIRHVLFTGVLKGRSPLTTVMFSGIPVIYNPRKNSWQFN